MRIVPAVGGEEWATHESVAVTHKFGGVHFRSNHQGVINKDEWKFPHACRDFSDAQYVIDYLYCKYCPNLKPREMALDSLSEYCSKRCRDAGCVGEPSAQSR